MKKPVRPIVHLPAVVEVQPPSFDCGPGSGRGFIRFSSSEKRAYEKRAYDRAHASGGGAAPLC
jgi:hypothetical protein